VLALIIYGTILFPSAHELIDYAAIDVFSGGSLWRPAGATTPPIFIISIILSIPYHIIHGCSGG